MSVANKYMRFLSRVMTYLREANCRNIHSWLLRASWRSIISSDVPGDIAVNRPSALLKVENTCRNVTRAIISYPTMVLDSENFVFLNQYKRNSVTEWLQRTGQATENGKFPSWSWKTRSSLPPATFRRDVYHNFLCLLLNNVKVRPDPYVSQMLSRHDGRCLSKDQTPSNFLTKSIARVEIFILL